MLYANHALGVQGIEENRQLLQSVHGHLPEGQWKEFTMNTDTTSFSTLVKLYEWFGECSGYPTTLVSDNGTQFTSKEFQQKMENWNIKHLCHGFPGENAMGSQSNIIFN